MSWFRLFVDRPVLASVLSIVLIIAGIGSFLTLPIAEYPSIAPPSITVSATYPGATAETAAQTVAAPLEEQINGIEGMVYMLSQSTGDGSVGITVTFEPGTDLDAANVLVQNRVARAEPSLPTIVRSFGVNVQKANDDILTIINMVSPDASRDLLYMSNYARTQIIDRLVRIDGVGQVNLFAERAYSMRVWLDPERLASRNLTAGEVVASLAENNVQVASGTLGGLPNGQPGAQQFSVQTQGRLNTAEEFGRIVVTRSEGGRVTRVSDVARVELGAQTYAISGYLSETPSIPIAIYASPDANALAVAEAVVTEIEAMSASFPNGLEYRIAYNPTEFITASINAVYQTIAEAGLLVVLTILLFLQSWRAAVIPVLSIPISLIGTFVFLSALGFSINTLTLFGLVLAIGIVVDDAIVVVENVQRYLREGLSPREAARRTMDDVSSALIAIGVVLAAVFIPVAFITGVTGIFFQQFALTVVSATTISVGVSLTLSAALSGALMRPPAKTGIGASLSKRFNSGFDSLSNGYATLTRSLIRFSPVVFLVYVGLIVLAALLFLRTPTGFIPDQDKGYFIAAVSLPPGATLPRTEAVVEELQALLLEHPAIADTVGFAGFNGATFTPATNGGAVFAVLEPFENRMANDHSVANIIGELWPQVGGIEEGSVFLLQPPPVQGLGSAGGFELYLQDRQGRGVAAMEEQLGALAAAANADPSITGAFSFFNTGTPRVFADINREKAEMLGIRPSSLNEALEINLGSAYVNDFTFIGRNYRVIAQADAPYRDELRDIASYRVRSDNGELVPLGSVSEFRYTTGADRLPRYNLYPSAELQGNASASTSSTEALAAMEAVAQSTLADGFDIEWTGLAFQQQQAGTASYVLLGLSVLLVFLSLAALYESWTLPFAVVLIVPMCLLSAMAGISLRGLDNNILTQVGLVVLLGLAAKNAILIVEFARQKEADGADRVEAAVEAARLRLRPILMTSLAFILGVVPLVIATGAGAELRQAIGTAVFGGMIGVTIFGLLFTPVFYVACRALAGMFETERTRPVSLEPMSQE